ncbi:MAG: DUF4384 domain-containing protein [Bryobacterales bacterium]|nr:DUF4384 domain-containing protein [Bryobacterales bacterium]
MSPRAVFLGLAGATLLAAAEPPMHNVEVTLERFEANTWRAIDPRMVLKPKEEVRFQFRSTFDGYLYVLNRTPAGDYMWIYPSADAGTDNRVRPGQTYTIPATAGAFTIPDKPGFDVVYWVLSPTVLRDLTIPPAPGTKSTLIPRCNDSELRARGACGDRSAGARAAGPALPKPLAGLESRELKVDRKSEASHIRFTGASDRALIYEFWIAHR